MVIPWKKMERGKKKEKFWCNHLSPKDIQKKPLKIRLGAKRNEKEHPILQKIFIFLLTSIGWGLKKGLEIKMNSGVFDRIFGLAPGNGSFQPSSKILRPISRSPP